MEMGRSLVGWTLGLLALGAVQGCSDKAAPDASPAPVVAAGPPPPAPGACSHPTTIESVKEVVVLNLGSGPLMQDGGSVRAAKQALSDGTARLTIEAIRTVSKDDAVGRSVCNGQIRIDVAAGTFDRLATNVILAAAIGSGGWRRDGQAESAVNTVAYIAQLTDDKQQVFVELQDGDALVQGAALIAVAASVTKTAGQVVAPKVLPVAATGSQAPATGMCADVDMTTTAGMLDCEGRRFQTADAKLNSAYKAAMASLPPDRQTALRVEQRAWLADRDPGCEVEVTKDGMGGTAATLGAAGCRANRTETRAAQIAAFR